MSCRNILAGIAVLFFYPASFAQVTLNADGPGNTYELINSVFAPNGNVIEAPDVSHPDFTDPNGEHRHIAEVWDSVLNSWVFEFYIHVTPDDDRGIVTITDRQRNEIKTYDASPANLKGTAGEIFIVKWNFMLREGFIPSSGFTHIHQIKAVGGDDGNPIFTLTARAATPNRVELLHYISASSTRLKTADLSHFSGKWVDVTETIEVGIHGKYSILVKSVADSSVILSYSNNDILTIRPDNDFIRPKWGIYRKFAPGVIRDETARFNDFSIDNFTPPSAPSNLVAAIVSGTSVNLSWKDNASDEDFFFIERSEDGGANWKRLDSLSANSVNYPDTGLLAGNNYLYRVYAVNSKSKSAYSNIASSWPFAPGNLTIQEFTDRSISLTWADNSTNESHFRVQRSEDKGLIWMDAAILDANTEVFTDTGLVSKTGYIYRVRAENLAGNSAYSDTAGAATLEFPVSVTTGEILDFNCMIFPNPASDIINIYLSLPGDSKIDAGIYNFSGQLVKKFIAGEIYPAGSTRKSFETLDLHNGIYLLRFMSETHVITRKIIIQK